MDVVIAVLVGILGLAIGLWFTRVFWIDASTGQATTLWERVRAGILFILSGSVPGAIQAIALTAEGGVLTIATFAGAFGLGLLAGYILPSRAVATDVFAQAMSVRIRTGSGRPTPIEVFAFGTRYESARARKLLALEAREFDTLFERGADEVGIAFKAMQPYEQGVAIDALCGVPFTQLARDHGRSPNEIALVLGKIFASVESDQESE